MTKPLFLRPTQLLDTGKGVFVARGALKFEISGPQAFSVTQQIFHALEIRPQEYSTLLQQFDSSLQETAQSILDVLIAKDLIYIPANSPNNPEELFYWHFKKDHLQVYSTLKEKKLLIIGLNDLSHSLADSLKRSGLTQIEFLSDPILSHPSPTSNRIDSLTEPPAECFWDCVIVVASHNQVERLCYWQQFCFKNNLNFFPILLNNLRGYIGPYIVPYKTACYECLISRFAANGQVINSHAVELEEPHQLFSTNGYHQAMIPILAGTACLEIVNLFIELRPKIINQIVDYNFMGQEVKYRKILRVPYCVGCDQHRTHELTAV